jgi:hypothetical protein
MRGTELPAVCRQGRPVVGPLTATASLPAGATADGAPSAATCATAAAAASAAASAACSSSSACVKEPDPPEEAAASQLLTAGLAWGRCCVMLPPLCAQTISEVTVLVGSLRRCIMVTPAAVKDPAHDAQSVELPRWVSAAGEAMGSGPAAGPGPGGMPARGVGGADGEVTGGCSPSAAGRLPPTPPVNGAAASEVWKGAAAADAAPVAAAPGVTTGVAGLMVALAVCQQSSCSMIAGQRLCSRALVGSHASTVRDAGGACKSAQS